MRNADLLAIQQRLVLALQAVKQRQWDQAEQLMAPVMATPLATPQIWTIYSAVARHRGETRLAVRRLRRAIARDPRDGGAIHELIAIAERGGDQNTVLRWLAHRLALDPGDAELHKRLARLLGLGAWRSQSARRSALRALVLAPGSSGSVMIFVTVELSLNPPVGGNPYRHMLRICCPHSPLAHELLLSDRLDVGDGVAARALFAASPPGLEERICAMLLAPGASVLDIGANKGATALAFLRAGAVRVECVEPNPAMVALIRTNVGDAARVHQTALADQEGEIDLLIPTGVPGAASIDPEFNRHKVAIVGGSEQIRVPLRTLDSLEIDRCDFWKVDVEGAEIDVMKGAGRTLRERAPRWILAEIMGEPFRPADHLDRFSRLIAATHPWRYEIVADPQGAPGFRALPPGAAGTPVAQRHTGTPLYLFASEPPSGIVP